MQNTHLNFKKMKTTLLLLCLSIVLNLNGQTVEWATKTSNCVNAQLIEKDQNDNIYIAGDSKLVKYNINGILEWSFSSGSIGYISDFKIDNLDNIYIIGTLTNSGIVGGTLNLTKIGTNDFYILKLDSNGNVIWGNNFGKIGVSFFFSEDECKLQIDENNNPVISCFNNNYFTDIDLDPSLSINNITTSANNLGFVAKYDSNGSFLFSALVPLTVGTPVQFIRLLIEPVTNEIYCIAQGMHFRYNSNGILLNTYTNTIANTNSTYTHARITDAIFSNNGNIIVLYNPERINSNGPGSNTHYSRSGILEMTKQGVETNTFLYQSNGYVNTDYQPEYKKSFFSRIFQNTNNELYILNTKGINAIYQNDSLEVGIFKFNSNLNPIAFIPFKAFLNSSASGNEYFTGYSTFTLSNFILNDNGYYMCGNLPVGTTLDFDDGLQDVTLTTSSYQCQSGNAGSSYLNKYCERPTLPNLDGLTSVCSGAINTYWVSNETNSTDFVWTFPAGWFGSSYSDSIDIVNNGTNGYVKVQGHNSCGFSSVDSIYVTVTATSVPSSPSNLIGDVSFCPNSTHLYSTLPASGAESYNWILPNGWTGSSVTNSISTIATVQAESGVLSVSAANVCGFSSPTILNVVSLVNNTVSYDPNTYTITANAVGVTYNWVLCNSNGTFTGSYGNQQLFTPTFGGLYAVEISDNGCTGISECINVSFVAVEENSMEDFTIYPNPTNSTVNIQFENFENSADLKIITLSGQTVINQKIDQLNSEKVMSLDVSNLKTGIYFVKVGNHTEKLIIE